MAISKTHYVTLRVVLEKAVDRRTGFRLIENALKGQKVVTSDKNTGAMMLKISRVASEGHD